MRVPRLNIVGGATLGPLRKLAALVAVTRELSEASDAENALEILLRESASLALDASVFCTMPASSSQPAGILNAIAPLVPTAAGGSKDAAMDDDLGALAEAIALSTVGLAIVAHPQQINSIRVRRGTQWSPDIPLWPTLGVAAGTVIALDPQAIVSAFGPEPELRTVKEASIVFDDIAPGAINVPGSSPAGSLFQTDSIGLSLRLRAAWCVRVPGCISWMPGVAW